MNKTIQEVMKSWLDSRSQALAERDIAVMLSNSSAEDSASSGIDFDSRERVGRVTAWEAGHCDLEVLEAKTGDQISWSHQDGVGVCDIDDLLDRFIEKQLIG